MSKKMIIIIGLIIVAIVLAIILLFKFKGDAKYESIKEIINNYDKISKETNYYYIEKLPEEGSIIEVWKN